MRFLVALAAVAISSTTAAAQAVPVTLSEFKIEMGRDTVHAGTVKFNIKNEGTTTHAFYIKGEGANKGSREVAAGESASFSLPLKAGTYEVYCPLADLSHKKAGMSRTLVVVAAAAPAATPTKKKPPTSQH
jgi:uncharacterized cupredoxin-like copper-binding protein